MVDADGLGDGMDAVGKEKLLVVEHIDQPDGDAASEGALIPSSPGCSKDAFVFKFLMALMSCILPGMLQ